MSILKVPAVKAPWPPRAANDKFFRYPKAHPVGKEKGESFATLAKRNGVGGRELVQYNFLTSDPQEINWYLANYVGCPAPKAGDRYYGFFGAPFNEAKKTGVIYIPMFGEEAYNHQNRLGQKIVEDYSKSSRKSPGGLCYETCYARVKDAGRTVGTVVPALDNKSTFGRLWGSFIAPKSSWLELPEEYRGKGAAGAMAWAGLGTLVDSDGIWRGDLEPGAVIQTWKKAGDYDSVKEGKSIADSSYGHSFIFLNYVYTGSVISGIAIADQGYQSGKPRTKGDYAYWVGANLVTATASVPTGPRQPLYGPHP